MKIYFLFFLLLLSIAGKSQYFQQVVNTEIDVTLDDSLHLSYYYPMSDSWQES